jgi:hypothetical protein
VSVVVIYREGEEIFIFSIILLILLKPFDDGLVHFLVGSQGWGTLVHQKPCHWTLERKMAPSWWGCLCPCV